MMFFSNTVASLLIQLTIFDKNVTSPKGERVEFAVRFCYICSKIFSATTRIVVTQTKFRRQKFKNNTMKWIQSFLGQCIF